MSSKNRNSQDVGCSKRLSYLLRHGALKEGLNVKPDGFIAVEELLSKSLQGYKIDDIERVVADNDKNRFLLRTNNGVLEIKANQGHSIPTVNELSLKLIENPDFDIIHGTYFKSWEIIKAEGLSRMKRNHVHFAKGLNFICGLRHSAQIYIYVDFKAATEDGLQFYESENGVILCAGNAKGIILPKYFIKVITKGGETLPLH